MNPHFRRFGDVREHIPNRAFGRLDHIELPGRGSTIALLAFDLVDADWLLAQGQHDARFSLDDLNALAKSWQTWSAQQTPGHPAASPFEDTPLYRLEVELPARSSWFGFPALPDPNDAPAFSAALGALETAWFDFSISGATPANASASLYPALFANPIPVLATGKMPTAQQGRALSVTFSLANLPTLSTSGLAGMLANAEADYLAAYDVGQGNAGDVPEPVESMS